MEFKIRFGIPLNKFWNELELNYQNKTLDKDEELLFRKLLKTFRYLSVNPKHNSLQTHEIQALTKRYGLKVWQSYLENRKPAAGRIFWVYGPGNNQITIIGLETHPENKNKSYDFISLSELPPK